MLASMTVDGLDLDTGLVLVMGKGRKERWMPLGAKALEELWEYSSRESKGCLTELRRFGSPQMDHR